jgi:hypothetical protein
MEKGFMKGEEAGVTKFSKRKARLLYLLSFLLLLGVEILIALFVQDDFIRPYIGDMLAVIVLYSLIRIFVPNGVRLLPLYIFVFAAFVELMQLFDFVRIFGMENNRFMRILIGSVFDIKDMICYGVSCVLLGLYEWKVKSIEKRSLSE